MRLARFATVTAVFGVLGGCGSPEDPQTWIGKLDDPQTAPEAVRNLQRLGNPVAIAPLCKLYEKLPHPDILKAIVSFHDKPEFKQAVPTLRKALDCEESNYTNSNMAAEALGDAKAADAVPELVAVLDKALPVKSRANLCKLSAIDALIRIGDKSQVAIDGLVRTMERPPEEQDFFVAKKAAGALGDLASPSAIKPLIHGLFLASTAHKPMWLEARPALIRMGHDAVQPLLDALAGKDEQLNALAKKLDFKPGILEAKVLWVLGDLRAKEALPVLRATLKKKEEPEDGLTNHAAAIYALGMIGGDEVIPDLAAVIDKHPNYKSRINAAQAMQYVGSPAVLPVLLKAAKTAFVMKDGEKYDDVRTAAAMTYARLAGPEGYDEMKKIADATGKAGERDEIWDQCLTRLDLARDCKSDAACYAKALADNGSTPESLLKQESAAFHLANLKDGASQLPALSAKIATKSDMIRIAVLYALDRVAPRGDKVVLDKLEDQIKKDSPKVTFAELVMEMRCTLGRLSST